LGQQHLQVLRTLKQAGQPVSEGLHRTAPFGMVKQGFALDTDEGYVLSEKGKSVLYLYDEVTDTERELLMRMYRARSNDEKFHIEYDSGRCKEELMRQGLINSDGKYLILTDHALQVWEGWVQFWDLKRQKGYATRKAKLAQENGAVPDNEDSPIDPTPSPSPVDGEGNCASECDECIHREVLNLISEKYPKVAELRDVLVAQKRLMKELGL
jgi:hypothetical protein